MVFTALISTVIFFSCTKVDNDKNYISGDVAFVEQAKTWFNTSFVNTAEYKTGTANGNFKTPNWKYGKTYAIGKTQVAEFPLITGRKKIYISENLSEADSRRIIDHTKFKVLFVKAPGKTMEVRIIQFTPTFNYLQSKNFNLSNLSFKDYTKEFKGDFMMFDFDNNFKRGYHFANDGIKSITLKTKFPNTNNLSGGNTVTPSSDLCDNAIELDGNCVYTVHTTYEVICTGGWNPEEGFNPDYCHIQITSIICELAYCNGNTDLENCLNQSNTQEECICSLYGVCGEDEVVEGCSGGGETCLSKDEKVDNALNNGTVGGGLNLTYAIAEIVNSTDRAGDVSYRTWKGAGWFNSFEIFAHFKRTYKLKPGRTAHTTNIPNDYIWKKLDFDHFQKSGTPFGYDVSVQYVTHDPQGLGVDGAYCTFLLKYDITITYGCCGFTQNRYKTIEDPFFFDRRLQ